MKMFQRIFYVASDFTVVKVSSVQSKNNILFSRNKRGIINVYDEDEIYYLLPDIFLPSWLIKLIFFIIIACDFFDLCDNKLSVYILQVPIVILKTKDMRNSTNIFLINLSVSCQLLLKIFTLIYKFIDCRPPSSFNLYANSTSRN